MGVSNRKVHAVATSSLVGKTNLQASSLTNVLPVGTIVFDPLETLNKPASGALFKFTAPYSRFYKIRALYKVVNLEAGYPNVMSLGLQAQGIHNMIITRLLLRKNGGTWFNDLSSIGGISTEGGVLAPYLVYRYSGATSLLKVGDTAGGNTNYTAAQLDCVTFLESGETIEFAYDVVHNGIKSPAVVSLKGRYPALITSFIGFASYTYAQGSILNEYFLGDIDNDNPATEYTYRTLLDNQGNQPRLSLAATSYVEIIELGRG